MSVRGRWFVTPHAVARYRERVRRVKDIGEGFELWRIRRPIGCRFRVQTRVPDVALPQLVTILPDHSDPGFGSRA